MLISDAVSISAEALPAANSRTVKSRIGSIGCSVRSSHATKPASRTMPPIKVPSTSPLLHPAAPERTSAHTIPKVEVATSKSPTTSGRTGLPFISVSLVAASGSTRAITGTLIQKIHCQASPSVTAPPTRGPPATARPMKAAYTPITAPRLCGGAAAVSRASAAGMIIAPPAPWTTRAPMSRPMFGERAQAAEANAKTTRPSR